MATHSAAASTAVLQVSTAAHATARSSVGWDMLLVCLAGYMLTAVGRVHQLFPALELVRPAILTGAAAILLYLVDRDAARGWTRPWPAAGTWLLALLGWMMLSVPTALVVGNSAGVALGDFAKTVVMFFVLAGSIRGAGDVERLAAVYLAGVTLYASVIISRFAVGGGTDWRLGHLYYYDANDFATFAVTAMPLGLYFLHATRRTPGRVLAAAALVVLTVAFVRAGSRGGFVAVLAVAGFIVLRYSAISVGRRLSALVLVALVTFGAASGRYWSQMGTILSQDDYNRTAESGRLHIWERGVGYMLAHPLLGVGPGNFQAAEGTLSPLARRQQFGVGVRWNAPHNSYVQAGAELGVPGLAIFLAFIAATFAALRRAGRAGGATDGSGGEGRELAQALTASLVGFVVGAFFLSLAYSEMLYTLAALAVGLLRAVTRPVSGRPAAP